MHCTCTHVHVHVYLIIRCVNLPMGTAYWIAYWMPIIMPVIKPSYFEETREIESGEALDSADQALFLWGARKPENCIN